MPISRALYVGQQVAITCNSGQNTVYLPISSASCEVSEPVDSISSFGHLMSLATAQTNLTTCKSTLKTYLLSGANVETTGSGPITTGLSTQIIQWLTGDAINGNFTQISVSPNGFTMSGILASLSADIALGGFGMSDLTFHGVGQPFFSPAPSSSTSVEQSNMPTSINPLTTIGIGGSVTGAGCASSFKFSLDMPTDNLACLGSDPNQIQGATQSSLIATKPPYKATITVEGYGVDVSSAQTMLSAAITGVYNLGSVNIQLPHPHVTSKSFNNAVGTAAASYSYVCEDTIAFFS